MISLGARVYLRACRAGEPGTVIREERGKLVVYWRDLDYWSRHLPEALEPATETQINQGREKGYDDHTQHRPGAA